jgi:hypothetical protein
MIKTVWVFHGTGGRFSSAIFSSIDIAGNWIRSNRLSGVLTEYPIDVSVYDWAIDNDYFEVKKADQATPLFMQNFTCASQEHFHFEDGKRDDED